MSKMCPVVHFEMPAEDRNRMAAFYQKAFGWKVQMLGPEMGDYVLVTTAESDVKPGAPAGAINGGFFPKKPDWPAQYPSGRSAHPAGTGAGALPPAAEPPASAERNVTPGGNESASWPLLAPPCASAA